MRTAPSMSWPSLAVLASALFVLLGGCGDGKDASATPTESASTVSPSGPPTSPASLSSGLLTVADLPDGWQLGEPGETFSPSTTFCGLGMPTGLNPQDSVDSAFSNGQNGFVLAQFLSRYEEGEAARVFDEYRLTIEPCREWTVPAADGSESLYGISVLAINRFSGDDIFGFKVTLKVDVGASSVNQATHFEMHIVLARFGDLISWLVYGGLPADGLPVDQTEEFVRLAASKIAQVAGG